MIGIRGKRKFCSDIFILQLFFLSVSLKRFYDSNLISFESFYSRYNDQKKKKKEN